MKAFSTILFAVCIALFVFGCEATNTNSDPDYCVEAYGQCDGRLITGQNLNPALPCCGASRSNSQELLTRCTAVNQRFSQCSVPCPQDRPCLRPNGDCVAADQTLDDGSGRPFCPAQQECVNPEWCYQRDFSVCQCKASKPCRNDNNGRCVALRPNGTCPQNSSRCPSALHEQCGGIGYSGPTSCQSPAVCVKYNNFFSRCDIPEN